MKTLQFKHLAPYLPYGLKGCRVDGGRQIFELTRVGKGNIYIWSPIEFGDSIQDSCNLKYIKPLLRPLSDLTKPITVEGYNDGKEFVPMDELYKLSDYTEYLDRIQEDAYEMNIPVRWPYAVVELLFQWHFDVFGLIDDELAVDINTIKK